MLIKLLIKMGHSSRKCIKKKKYISFYIGGGGGGFQLHFCTWPPDFCQMYMYKNVQKCTKMYKICFFLFGHQIFAKCTCTKMYKNVQNMFFPVWPPDFCQMYIYKNVQNMFFPVFPVPFPGISDFLYIFYDH